MIVVIRVSPPEHRPATVDAQQSGRPCMFRCQACGNVVPPRVSAERIVVETRPRIYPFRSRVMREVIKKHPLEPGERADDRGGAGREIVREIRVCPPCKRSLPA